MLALQAWNLGGKDYRGDLGYEEETEGVTGIIFMVDSTSSAAKRTAYPKVQKQLFQMLDTDWCQKLRNLKVLVMANKQDYVSQTDMQPAHSVLRQPAVPLLHPFHSRSQAWR